MTQDRDKSAGRLRPVLARIGWAAIAVLLLLIIGWLEMSQPVRAASGSEAEAPPRMTASPASLDC